MPEAWLRRAIRLYLRGAPADDPRASPILADVSDAPPTLIQVAEGEVLGSHARRAAALLPEVVLSVTPGVAHVWQLNAGWMPEADAAVAEAGTFLRRA